MCMDHMLFIHSSVDDQLGHFHPLVIMNHAAVNTCRPISLRDPAFPCFNLLRFPLSCCKTGRRGTPALLLCREHAREAVKVALYRPPAAGLETGPPWNHPAGRRGPGGEKKDRPAAAPARAAILSLPGESPAWPSQCWRFPLVFGCRVSP